MPKSITEKFDMSSFDIEQAQSHLRSNIDRFESAMEKLADRIEGVSHKIHSPARVYGQWKSQLATWFGPIGVTLEPYMGIAAGLFSVAAKRVRANPRPYVLGSVALVGGYLLISYLRKRRLAAPAEGNIEATAEMYS